MNQKELELFREELQSRLSSNYNVILKERKLPLSLLNDHQKVNGFSFNWCRYEGAICLWTWSSSFCFSEFFSAI